MLYLHLGRVDVAKVSTRQVLIVDSAYNAYVGTLLNRLFGTGFTERKPGVFGPGTKGIWISRAQDKPVLVLDVQGLDDYDFDCKSTLFLMASSSVLVFNLWEHQVGLNVGANMDLLRLVIELKLQMYPSITQ